MKIITPEMKDVFRKTDHSDWELFAFEDVAFNISEHVDPGQVNSEIYVGLEHLDPDSIHIRRKGVASDVKGTKLRVYKGDVIFGKRRAYQRKAAIADFDGICSAHAMVIRANPENIDPDFFPFFLHSDTFMHRAIEISEGSLSPTIKWKILKEQKFRLPPLPVQKKLAEILWAADATEEKCLVAIQQADISLQSVFQEKYQDKKGEEISLGKIALINPGLSDKEVQFQGNSDFIPMEAVSEDGEISLGQKKDFQSYKSSLTTFRNGDIIFAKITPCMENGKGAIVDGIESPAAIGSTEFHVLRPHIKSDIYYIYYLTKLPFFRKLAERHMTGSAGQKRVPTSFLKNFKLRAPDEEGREILGSLCNKIWNEKKQCESQFEATKSLRGAILNSIV